MVAVAVVGHRERAVVAAGRLEGLLGRRGVELAGGAADVGLVAVHHGRHPTGRRHALTLEDLLDDQLTVDGLREGLPQLGVVLELGSAGEKLT